MVVAVHQTRPKPELTSALTSEPTSDLPFARACTPAGAASLSRLIVTAIGTSVAAMLAAAVVLWFHYGTAVFYDMILSGISACF